MNKFKTAWKVALKFVDDNLPTILSGLALVGLGASVVSAAKDGAKAQEAIEDGIHRKLFTATDEELETMDAERVDEKPDDYAELGYDGMVSVGTADEVKDIILYKRKKVLTFWEKFTIYGKVYWKTATLTLLTGACIISSNLVSKRRYLGLAALVATRTKELDEYKEKAKELFGEKKTEQIDHEIAKDKIMDCPKDIDSVPASDGKEIMYFCGEYWRATREEVRAVFNKWNQECLANCSYRSLDDDHAVIIDQDCCELALETLLDDYLAPTFGVTFHDTWAYRFMTWDIIDGLVEAKFDPGQTALGHLGYFIKPSRKPDHDRLVESY